MSETGAASPVLSRQKRLSEILSSSVLDFVVLNPGPTLTYLTGLVFHLMERPVIAIFGAGGGTWIVTPDLEKAKLERLPFKANAFSYPEDPSEWPGVFEKAARAAGLGGRLVGVEPTRLRFLELKFLEAAAPAAQFVSGEEVLAALRMRKDSQEIAAMRQAVQIAQNALKATLPVIRPGISEREVASELILQLYRTGSDPELPFAPIVSGGPNSANPHASPSDRPLQRGDLLVIDWGASYHGYISDLTRTFAVGEASQEFKRIAELVKKANEAGRAAAGPEVTAEIVDQAARQVIEQAGYGEFFIHRTGHGIGMEPHEGPYIRSGNRLVLQSGMAFTVEPGIYLPGQGGVRIEDNVVISASGVDCLSDLPRDLVILE
jgi:Xaa-Pro dipeptidase